jgi:hypothetical protein
MMARKAAAPPSPLVEALARVVEREVPPPLSVHMNLVLDTDVSVLLNTLTEDPDRNLVNRSKALRYLINKGAAALLADERGQA